MKRLLLGSVFVHALWFSAFAQIGPESAQELIDRESSISTGNGISAQMATIDPETGQLISKPVDVELSPSQGTGFGESQSQSFELSGSAPKRQLMSDGSTKIDFNGQFMIPLTAEVDSEGTVKTGHHIDHEDAKHKLDQRD